MKNLNFEIVVKCREFCRQMNLEEEIASNLLLFLLLSDLDNGLVLDVFSCRNQDELKTFLSELLVNGGYSEHGCEWSKVPMNKKVEKELWRWSTNNRQYTNIHILKNS